MEYELANDVSMKLANCSIYKKKGIYEKVSAGAKIFEGVVVKLSRNCNISNNILIERNKIFKGKERVKDTNQEFEKYFDLYADEMENIDAIVNEGVKKELVKLYKEYGIMFEISLHENNIYIRFFTGELFETKTMTLTAINKKTLYKEYVIFKTILILIYRINNLFNDLSL